MAAFEPAYVFAGLAEAGGIRRGAGHVRQLTIFGGGAAGIWTSRPPGFPGATQAVGLFHAREHLHGLARSLEFKLGDHKQDWLAARLQDLDDGGDGGVCAAARLYPLARRHEGRAGHRPGLLRARRAPDALQLVPLPRPVRRLRRR